MGNCIIQLKCVPVPNIGCTKEGSIREVSQEFEKQGYDLSDLLLPESGNIDVLIGCNYSNLQQQSVAIIGTVTLAKSRFGTVLYGAHRSFPKQEVTRNIGVSADA